jgi:hypothetical protein
MVGIRDPRSGIRVQGSKRHRIPDPDPQHWLKIRLLKLVKWKEDGVCVLFIDYGKLCRERERESQKCQNVSPKKD